MAIKLTNVRLFIEDQPVPKVIIDAAKFRKMLLKELFMPGGAYKPPLPAGTSLNNAATEKPPMAYKPLEPKDIADMQMMVADKLMEIARAIGNGRLRVTDSNIEYETMPVTSISSFVHQTVPTGAYTLTMRLQPESEKFGD